MIDQKVYEYELFKRYHLLVTHGEYNEAIHKHEYSQETFQFLGNGENTIEKAFLLDH